MALTYRNDVGCMWLNAITKQSLRLEMFRIPQYVRG